MADGIEFNLLGVDALVGKLAEVSSDVRRKGGRAALRKAAQVVANHAKENAARLDDPETGRSIASNIALRWNGRLFKQSGNLGFRVGVLHGAVLKNRADKGDNAPTPHWRLLEFGTHKMAAQPFLRRALADNYGEATQVFLNEYSKAIGRAIRRAAKAKGGS